MATDEEATGVFDPEDDARSRRILFDDLRAKWLDGFEAPADDPRGYVEHHLQRALPRGWVVNFRIARCAQHLPQSELTLLHHEWKIFRDRNSPETELDYYIAHLDSNNELVLVYGNTDAGIMGPDTFWQRAMCVPLANLGLVLPFVFARPHEFPPNRFGVT